MKTLKRLAEFKNLDRQLVATLGVGGVSILELLMQYHNHDIV